MKFNSFHNEFNYWGSDKPISQAQELKLKMSCPGEHNTAIFKITNSFLCWKTQQSLNYVFDEAEQS